MPSPEQVVQSSEAVPLFPTFVWKTQLQEHVYRRINDNMHSALARLTRALPAVPAAGKFQTDQTLHQLAELTQFCDIVLSAANGVLDFMSAQHTPLIITGCWANISAPGATHKAHTHPNNYLSGVYYLQADEGARHINFDDPRPQTNIMNPQVRETNAQNAAQIHLGVSEGMLVLFPAWLQHSVPENRSARNRISIAFNLMFTRFGEEMALPKWDGNIPVRP
jgi:uncharacterized protein (TIGR02466 family)